MTVALAPAPIMSLEATVYSAPLCEYSYASIKSLTSPAYAAPTIASLVLLFNLPDNGTSVASLPSAILPNSPYELFPFVARIIPPSSARYPICA